MFARPARAVAGFLARGDVNENLSAVSPALSLRGHTFEERTTWQSTKRRWLLTKRM
jgi:hypothetical protein